MIIPDVNLLIYAHDEAVPSHAVAHTWWEAALNGEEPVGLPWVVLLGFIRVTTHPSILRHPLPVDVAVDCVAEWLKRACVLTLDPVQEHWDRIGAALKNLGAAGNLTTDAHIAVLAMEHGAELYSTDQDFGHFPHLRWRNPLV